jgi:hypothetical protein
VRRQACLVSFRQSGPALEGPGLARHEACKIQYLARDDAGVIVRGNEICAGLSPDSLTLPLPCLHGGWAHHDIAAIRGDGIKFALHSTRPCSRFKFALHSTCEY